MKRFYLTGHRSFGNRGCEAIVRSTADLLRARFGAVELVVPSDDIARDLRQWPSAADHGIIFTSVYSPTLARYWTQLQRLAIPALKRASWPFAMPAGLKASLDSVDAVLSIGGDMYTYEGRLPSWIMGIDQMAMSLGKPVVLWGATVGPFEMEPYFLPKIHEHLQMMSLIAVRETISEDYLIKALALNNVLKMPDTAFFLQPEPVAIEPFWPTAKSSDVLGLNVSPLIGRLSGADRQIKESTLAFIRHAVEELGLSVLLIPHVTPLNGSMKNSDAHYMHSLLKELTDCDGRVSIMDSSLNSAQTKFVISKCRYFIGARMHSTIAAMSSGVPTLAIGYSVKAKGVSFDVFGHSDYVIDVASISAQTLLSALERLIASEDDVKRCLSRRLDLMRAGGATSRALDALAAIVS